MSKTIIVSNRLPVEFKISGNRIQSTPSVGGLATGLKSVHATGESLWIGWPGLTSEQIGDFDVALNRTASESRMANVFLKQAEVRDFYFGFSNKSLWPLFHYFLEYTLYDPKQWDAYYRVNQKYAECVLAHAEEGDRIWIHDYQLMLVPSMIREKRPDVSIGFFLHIPFPAFEIFRTCPWRDELLSGLLGADLIGFHTYDYVQHFLNSVKRIKGFSVKFNEVDANGRTVKVDSFPMGVDFNKFHFSAAKYEVTGQQFQSDLVNRLQDHLKQYPDSRLILSIDRLDYTKGIPNRIRAFQYFLERHPEYIGKVRLVMLAVPSREDVPQYRKLKRETDELVGRVNGKFATIDWTPIWYFYRSLPYEDLVALYTTSHIAMITPLRDGMNLVAKEYVATRIERDGVLILSEMAGAANELSQALLINPENMNQISETLDQALRMPLEEQRHRMEAMQKRLSRYTIEKWANDFVTSLEKTVRNTPNPAACRKMTPSITETLLTEYRTAHKKLVLLDYDGTLVGFRDNPEDAVPDAALYQLLNDINKDEDTEIAIISGRNRAFLERWFNNMHYTLISDHGVWMRRAGKKWEKLEDPKTDWKDSIRNVMEDFVDRTPGAFVEEKEYSLAWHFRKADDELALIRERELRILLAGMVGDNGLSVLEGSKVIEVKSNLVNKGRAVTRLILDGSFDYVFAAGDDHTDEYMFAELPEMAHTVKVGNAPTVAKYYTGNPNELRKLMNHFTLN
ncbi:bifunctional alpha,alpha-trehalose-phosphate synthase (UDP-forming)/trehalose-phosphatase [Flavobacterium sp. MAH-1]|uniref:Bifunctional alpha,alpha-trehalose-phosphate synthase (UDP-forming)/trehalose-phosphatase n=1 Tax=Flavobacterium agri TaxID=2743471 RepID=A0A7Y8Y148_9FLAO|nr:bifunctional alpha,alpha-trehalose-phosphate synthase (UDP-forming)/trehalose-phosphatase [Flavobacterium agri]NUY80496.1 bifunctional alpha,alpha-trehalose-phosphate synthase (UDP-forming)/trehalose-phosphatase [Flavobacterium agri]NYA70521.1 bifunctional alpha,alpha-trehalose-phosphate synthase (UDP-forming)/trehalose-phosphatase [Flavobacterium agri]